MSNSLRYTVPRRSGQALPLSRPCLIRRLLALVAGAVAALAVAPGHAAPALPDLVKQAGALNTGGTSFYDGFGRLDEGFSAALYVALNTADRISTETGKPNPAFNNPQFDNLLSLNQLFYTTDWHPLGGVVAFSAAVPVINFSSHFDTPGEVLHNNGLGIGDTTWGPIWQSRPVLDDTGRAVFSYRLQMQIIAPTGAFDSSKNINQSAGFWVINPYVAFSWLPTKDLEVSARLHYVYNLATDRFSAPPRLPDLTYQFGQAGTAGFVNFAGSYRLSDSLSIGVNGFYFKQFTDDSLNGLEVAGSRQNYLFFGPGGRIELDSRNFANFNVYLPLLHDDVTTGPRINLMLVHRF